MNCDRHYLLTLLDKNDETITFLREQNKILQRSVAKHIYRNIDADNRIEELELALEDREGE